MNEPSCQAVVLAAGRGTRMKSTRAKVLHAFLDHVEAHDRVWVTRRIDIARHWKQVHPFDARTAFAWPPA